MSMKGKIRNNSILKEKKLGITEILMEAGKNMLERKKKVKAKNSGILLNDYLIFINSFMLIYIFKPFFYAKSFFI